MRSDRVVILTPGFHNGLRLRDAAEPVLVQTLVPKFPVEAFDVGVLHRLARRDEVQAYAVLIGPGIQ